MEKDNNNDSSFKSVASATLKELNYYYKTLKQCISSQPEIRKHCYNNQVNHKGQVLGCSHCQQSYNSHLDDEEDSDRTQDILTTAAFYGLILSTGSLTNSNLVSLCSRLQKHDRSLASLNYDSFVDVVYSDFDPLEVDLLNQHQQQQPHQQHQDNRNDKKKDESVLETIEVGDDCPLLGDTFVRESVERPTVDSIPRVRVVRSKSRR